MTTKERCFFLCVILVVVLVTVFKTADAGDWYYYEHPETYEIYPTLRGTDIRDYSRPGYHIEVDRYENERAYPTLPGTDIRDYSRPGYRIDRR